MEGVIGARGKAWYVRVCCGTEKCMNETCDTQLGEANEWYSHRKLTYATLYLTFGTKLTLPSSTLRLADSHPLSYVFVYT